MVWTQSMDQQGKARRVLLVEVEGDDGGPVTTECNG